MPQIGWEKSFSIKYMLITALKNRILTLTHKTAHCTYGQACNPRILSHLSNLS
jgi:hypothetical protein